VSVVFQPSLVRRGLDELLAQHPHLDVVSVDWQLRYANAYYEVQEGAARFAAERGPMEHLGPWVLIELGQPSVAFGEHPAWAIWRFAVWKATGSVYRMRGAAVDDDPLIEVEA
jgi:hypothetical protein